MIHTIENDYLRVSVLRDNALRYIEHGHDDIECV